jgi:uncharacterized protein (DUF488 family)
VGKARTLSGRSARAGTAGATEPHRSYLNLLLNNSVTLLCDVRRNALSRKYGFSKSTLSKACEGVGIRYEHLPELGIDSEERRELNTQADYDALFAEYKRKSLPRQTQALARIRGWVQDGERVALICFERLPHQCHRHCVAEALAQHAGKDLVAQQFRGYLHATSKPPQSVLLARR